ncbi:MAG: beta-ketoacyl synthase N-terminal-like domain-containing protein [Deltaproteobacteria bacterium]|nr:beta-ketoacyl synthase N-terminal-like domain-containing protein [Deltaproteobacteria bacterium]
MQTDRIVVAGWGVVAPGASGVSALRSLLLQGKSAITTPNLGPLGEGLFAVGQPSLDEAALHGWLSAHWGPARATQWVHRAGDCVKFTVAACAEALESNAGLEALLRALDPRVRVILGTGLTDLGEAFRAREDLTRATRVWESFWADPARNEARRVYERARAEGAQPTAHEPEDYRAHAEDSLARYEALLRFNAYWTTQSDQRARFEAQLREIERSGAVSDLARGPLRVIAARQRALRSLLEKFGAPPPPWHGVDPQLLWSIPNAPAAELTMLLGLHGPAFAPAGACAAFGLSLSLACEAIAHGACDAAIVGACDPSPLPEVVAAFHRARLTPACGTRNDPFTELRGTHVAGGACVWIITRESVLRAHGLVPVGPAIVGHAVSSDAEHMITPSEEGPRRAIGQAIAMAGITPGQIALWDLHASGTPGDASELAHVRQFAGPKTRLTARKGQLGHGMGVAGGWEITALALSLRDQYAMDTGIDRDAIHPELAASTGGALVTRGGAEVHGDYAVKVSLGVGGITSCVVIERMA